MVHLPVVLKHADDIKPATKYPFDERLIWLQFSLQCHLDNRHVGNLHLTYEVIVSIVYESFLTFWDEMIQLEYVRVQH